MAQRFFSYYYSMDYEELKKDVGLHRVGNFLGIFCVEMLLSSVFTQ